MNEENTNNPNTRGRGIEENKSFDKLKETIKDLKLEFSKSAKIQAAVSKCKSGVKKGTKATAVKAYSATGAFITHMPIFLAIIFVLMFYGNTLFEIISSSILNIFNLLSDNTPWFTVPVSAYGWFSAMVTIFIIVNIIIFSIPTRESEWKSKILNKSIGITLGILVIILVWGGISPNESLADTSLVVVEEGKDTSKSLLENLICYTKPECFMKKENKDETKTVDTQKFSVTLDGQKYRPYSYEGLKEEPIDLKYLIETGEDSPIYLSHIVCRLGDDRGEVLSNISLENREVLNNAQRAESGIYCKIGNLSLDDIKSSNLKLRVQLYYKTHTTLTQKIPFLKVDSQEERDKLDYSKLEKGVKISTNNLISLDPQSSASNFEYPILVGEGADIRDEYRFNFIIKLNNKYSSSGELLDTQLNDVTIPNVFEYSSKKYTYPYELLTDDGESNLRFKLKLASSEFEDEDSHSIHFFTESTIMKKDTIYIEISDYEEQKEKAKNDALEDEENPPQNSPEYEEIIAEDSETEFELVSDS